jgi:hypothetical protein
MGDALTIVVVHFSRQQSQSLLNVGQDLRLKAGADFLQHENADVSARSPRLGKRGTFRAGPRAEC